MLCWRGPGVGRGTLPSSLAMRAPALLSAPSARSTCREWVSPCHSKVTSKHSVSFGLQGNADTRALLDAHAQHFYTLVETEDLRVQIMLILIADFSPGSIFARGPMATTVSSAGR